MFLQEEINRILQKKGDIRGVAFQSVADYILKKQDAEGLKKVERKMQEWGVPFEYKTIKTMGWYPIAWGALFVLATQDVFGWTDSDIRDMGVAAPKASLLAKLFFKLFFDMKKVAEHIPAFWQKNYTIGEMRVIRLNEDKKEMVLHLIDCSFHPALCQYTEGYIETSLGFSRPRGSVLTVKETKCSLKDGTPFEEYLVQWT